MLESKQIVKFISNNLNKKNYVSLFTIGSLPKILKPKNDLDIFFVISPNKRNIFFNEIEKIIKKLIKKDNTVAYSFFRGPLKLKDKGLIHILVYLNGNVSYKQDKIRKYLINEQKLVLKSFKDTAKLIRGKSIKELLRKVDLENSELITVNIDSIKNKQELLKTKGYIIYPEWKKINGIWKFKRIKKHVDNYLKTELLNYYKKRIPKKTNGTKPYK